MKRNSKLRMACGLVMLVLLATSFVVKSHRANAAESKKRQPHIVFVIGEREYKTMITLPKFAKSELEKKHGFKCSFVHADADDKNHFPGLEALETADLMVLSVRRRSLPEKQLAAIRKYLDAGKPLVGIRTASHAFDTKGKHPDGHAEWRTFDPDVLGGSYNGHHGNSLKTSVQTDSKQAKHPILNGVSADAFIVGGSLYKVRPLQKTCTVLMTGRIDGAEVEPVAWTNTYRGGRVFYTSLGHIDDFKIPAFRRMFLNGILWALER